MKIKSMMNLTGMAIMPELNNRRNIKVHPKYLFSLIGFGIGSLISFIIIVAEEFNGDVLATMGHSYLHNLAIPVLFGLLGTLIGYIYGKQRHTKAEAFQEIFASQQTMSLILDHLPMLIAYLDADFRYLYVNKTFEKWHGLSADDVYGKPVNDILSAQACELIRVNAAKSAEGGIISFESSREFKGEEHFINSTMVPHFGSGKKIMGFFTIVTDITKLKKRENKIRKQKDELAELNATKDKFFSIIAHDLKNPFNSLLGFSDLLHNDYETLDENTKKEFIGSIYKEAANTFKLLGNLLAWAHTQRGQIVFNPSRLNISQLVDENINLLRSMAASKNVGLKSELDRDYFIHTDGDLISAVIRNLLTNALKFTPANGLVAVSARQSDDWLEVSVSDSGVGISPENLTKLFRIDENYSTPGTGGETGTGLGLMLCKEFVLKCGGTIGVESEVGKGSIFSFTLPILNNLIG